MVDISDVRSNFTSAPGASQTSVETVLCSQRVFFNYTRKGAGVACIILYQSANKTTCMHCRGQLSHEVTKNAIKAALKLCMHVMLYLSHI